MLTKQFSFLVNQQLDHCKNVLQQKESIYGASDDRLQQFLKIAVLTGLTPRMAVGALMAKHITALYDYLNSTRPPDDPKFDEEITDTINYLLLLRGVLNDEFIPREHEKDESASLGQVFSQNS